ncbi:MAG: DUF4350 domain-containing protein [Anaerolineales bacterium]
MQTLRELSGRLPGGFGGGLAILGTASLSAAVLGFMLAGELTTLVFVGLLLGVAGLSGWFMLAPDDLRAFFSGRRTASGLTSIIVTILFITFVVAVYVQTDRQNLTVDFTTEAAYTLNQPSLNTIERVRQVGAPIRIVGFYPRADLRAREAADIVLRQYDAEGGDLIDVQYVDPDQEPLIARQYAYNNYISLPSRQGRRDALYVSFLTPEGQPDPTSIRPIPEVNERLISTEILSMLTVGDSTFYFTTGHTELSIESDADTGISRAADGLLQLGIRSATLNLLTADIPDDATALVIAGPQSAFDAAEVEKIATFVSEGGRLIVLANPPLIDPTFGQLNNTLLAGDPLAEYLWDEFGLRLQETFVVDEGSSFDSEFNPVPAFFGNHPIMQGFDASTSIVFSVARTVQIAQPEDGAAFRTNYLISPLVFSSENSYAETELRDFQGGDLTDFDEDADPVGPLAMAAAARSAGEINLEEGPRVVVVGDADWLTNTFITSFAGNGLLWGAIAEWVAGTPEIVSPDAVIRNDLLPITATDQQRQRISILTTLVIPLGVLIVGGLVWFIRRRQ